MTAHCTAETLSAYLDAELTPVELRGLEAHLSSCEACQDELELLRRVVHRARALEHLQPPSVLGLQVQRRVVLEAAQGGLADRLEQRLGRWGLHSNIVLAFALIFAFAAIIYVFSAGLQRRQLATIPVVFGGESVPMEIGDTIVLAGRRLTWDGAAWRQDGLTGTGTTAVQVGTPEWKRLVDLDPSLTEIASLEEPVVVGVGESVVMVVPASARPRP